MHCDGADKEPNVYNDALNVVPGRIFDTVTIKLHMTVMLICI